MSAKNKPINPNPLLIIGMGVAMIVVSVLLQGFVPMQEAKVVESKWLNLTGPGMLALIGGLLCVWPVAKRAWGMWQSRKK